MSFGPRRSVTANYIGDSSAAGAIRSGQARPLSIASADFDEDGVPDIVSGYASPTGTGILAIQRGNIQALWPPRNLLSNEAPEPFLPDARTIQIPESPDFIGAGDFDADGHWDIVTARLGSSSIYLLRGDGRGGFAAPQRITLPGKITAFATGEINRRDGLTDIAVGVTNALGARALVFESPMGAARAVPETFPLPSPATAMTMGMFDGGPMRDLAIAAGDAIVVVHGRDRKLSLGVAQRASVAPARVTVQRFGFHIQALATGDFTGAGPAIAALGDDGKIHVLEHALGENSPLKRLVDNPNFVPTFQTARNRKDEKPSGAAGGLSPAMKARLETLRSSRWPDSAGEWKEKDSVALPGGFSQRVPQLVTSRVTSSMEDDLLAPDAGNNRLHVFSTVSRTRHPGLLETGHTVTAAQMRLLDSFESGSAPARVLPMRLSKSGLHGLVSLEEGVAFPIAMQQTIPPANIFTVTNTSDALIPSSVPNTPTGPPGSLRAAMLNVELANSANNGGSYEIDFDIPTTDPGYDSSTGTFLIQPLSQGVPGDLNDWALPPIGATVTIDGYTQPGASPNTLATADNAVILIRIDGALATTPGGSGFAPYDCVNSTFRGFDFTGWTNPDISGGSASGAEGIEENGLGDYIEGNFFGTDPTGTIAINPNTGVNYANRIGVFATNGGGSDNGAIIGGTIIGGTTPQARNIFSNNQVAGALFLLTAYEGHLVGNFIGLDASGAKALPNRDDGTGANGPTITIGGTLAGDGNVISANNVDVDFNDITNEGQASDSIAQGNLIGTDATGTLNVSNGAGTGAGITDGPTDETIGGTTPAARNVISGNFYGVYIFNSTTNNVIQGNFIGTDVTGTKAIGNAQQGLLQGVNIATETAAVNTVIGGETPGAGNLISGNALDGISISGTVLGGLYGDTPQGSAIEGNLIGTDVTGTMAIPNGASGISLLAAASANVIGGTDVGAGNIIAYNASHGILIDAASNGDGDYNNVIGNTILSNGGTGVRVDSGFANLISRNSIFGNGDLGIALGTGGANINTPCGTATSGPNNLEDAPTLTAGTGSAIITATATDPNDNTSQFSNAVQATASGNLLSLIGNFVGNQPNTTYTIEFFSSLSADPSGYGQGQTYLGSASVTTDASCSASINTPVTTTDADVAITLSNPSPNSFYIGGEEFSGQSLTASVTNNGPATATNVVVTDILPAGMRVNSFYCNVGPCQSPVSSSVGSCTISGSTVTCNLGTMPAGTTASVTIPVQVLSLGSITDSASVTADQTDPNLANNSANSTVTTTYFSPLLDHITPAAAIAGSPDLLMTVYGSAFVPESSVSFNGTALPTAGYLDNQVCAESNGPMICEGIQVIVPAAMLASAGTPSVTVTSPNNTAAFNSETFTIAPSCSYLVDFIFIQINLPFPAAGTSLIPYEVDVNPVAPTCSWTASSSVPWMVPLETGPFTGFGSVDFAVAPNTSAATLSGNIIVAGQTQAVQQSASSPCSYSLNPSAEYPAAGGAESVDVTITGSGCGPFVTSYAPWLTVTGNSGLLVASGPATFTVATNTGAPRTGAILVGGDVFTVNQDAPNCYFTLSTTSATFGVAGGTGSIGVTPSTATCGWTAASSNPSQLSITSGASGSGNGTINYSVSTNTGGPVSASITVSSTSGGSSVFSVTQASAFTCTFLISPSVVNVPADGTANNFGLTASYSFCNWTAVSNDPSALSVTVSPSGEGSATIYYAVGQNTSAQPRTLTITAGCQTFTVTQEGTATSNPVPLITSLLPAGAIAGGAGFTLTVNGSGFVSGATVSFGGNNRATTFVSSTQLTVAVLASDIASVGTPAVVVTNPTPGGGASNTVNFNVTATANPVPAITSLMPGSAAAGGAAFMLTVNGTGFVNGVNVSFGGNSRTTTFVSSTQVTAAILASDIATVGTPAVVVTNPAPGGGPSNSVSFSVTAANNPVPAITSLMPASATAGGTAFTLSVNGTAFVSGANVSFGGNSRTTTFVSSTQVTAAILASDISNTGTPAVVVTNPTPGGGPSNSVSFAINNPVPSIANLAPMHSAAGSAFVLTVNGSGFISTSTVLFNGSSETTIFVSATELTASIPASALSTGGTVNVAVKNPAPGGGTSGNATFTIDDYSVAGPSSTTNIAPGQATPVPITLTPTANGFANAIELAVSGLPKGMTGQFTQNPVTPGAAVTMVTLNLTATPSVSGQIAPAPRIPLVPLGSLLLGVPATALMFARRRLRRTTLASAACLWLLLLCGLAGSLAACNGGFPLGNPNATPTGPANVTVTATSGTVQQTTNVMIDVEQ